MASSPEIAERRRKVVNLIYKFQDREQIAKELGVGVDTIKSDVAIMRKDIKAKMSRMAEDVAADYLMESRLRKKGLWLMTASANERHRLAAYKLLGDEADRDLKLFQALGVLRQSETPSISNVQIDVRNYILQLQEAEKQIKETKAIEVKNES